MVDKNEQREHSLWRVLLNIWTNVLLMSLGMSFALKFIVDYEIEISKIIVGTTVLVMYLYKPSDKKAVNYYNMSIDRMNFNAAGVVILFVMGLGKLCGLS